MGAKFKHTAFRDAFATAATDMTKREAYKKLYPVRSFKLFV